MSGRIRKALIPAAGLGTRMLPATLAVKKELFPVVDETGTAKPVIHFNVAAAVAAGVNDIAIIVQPGEAAAIQRYFEPDEALRSDLLRRKPELEPLFDELLALGERLTFIEQREQEGYGHAVWCARRWTAGEPFILLLGDHIFRSTGPASCERQLIGAFERYGVSTSAVVVEPESSLPGFGTIAGEFLPGDPTIIAVTEIVEKPEAAYARAHLRVPGLAQGEYFCWFGIHAFTPEIFEALNHQIEHNLRQQGEFQLTAAQELLRRRQGRYHAYVMQGTRYDVGVPSAYRRTVAALGPPEPTVQG